MTASAHPARRDTSNNPPRPCRDPRSTPFASPLSPFARSRNGLSAGKSLNHLSVRLGCPCTDAGGVRVHTSEGRPMYPGIFAESAPDRPAVIMDDGQAVTYRELDAGSNRFAQFLVRSGFSPGDVVAVLMENNARYHEVCWG